MERKFKKALFLAALTGLLIIAATIVSCSSSPAATTPGGGLTIKPTGPGATTGPDYTPPANEEVTIENFAYSPAALTIKAGTTVTWTNKDSVQHTVTSDKPLFDSGLLAKGQSFSYTFNEKGEYGYHCIPHPYMTGKITVE